MIFHLSFELPKQEPAVLDAESPDLTSEEIRILKRQIRDNTRVVETYVNRIDLFARSASNQLMQRVYNGSSWGAWGVLGNGLFSSPTAASWDVGRLDVFGIR